MNCLMRMFQAYSNLMIGEVVIYKRGMVEIHMKKRNSINVYIDGTEPNVSKPIKYIKDSKNENFEFIVFTSFLLNEVDIKKFKKTY